MMPPSRCWIDCTWPVGTTSPLVTAISATSVMEAQMTNPTMLRQTTIIAMRMRAGVPASSRMTDWDRKRVCWSRLRIRLPDSPFAVNARSAMNTPVNDHLGVPDGRLARADAPVSAPVRRQRADADDYARTALLVEIPLAKPGTSAPWVLADGDRPHPVPDRSEAPIRSRPAPVTRPDRIRRCYWCRRRDSNPRPAHYEVSVPPRGVISAGVGDARSPCVAQRITHAGRGGHRASPVRLR